MKYFPAFFLVALLFACNTRHHADFKASARLPETPPDVLALVDTLNRGNLGDDDTALAMKMTRELLLKYPASRDSYTHYILIQQLARNYYIRDNKDSILKYMTMGISFFERQPYFTKWPLIDHYRLSICNYELKRIPLAVWHATKARLAMQHPDIHKYMPPAVLINYLLDLSTLCRATTYYEDALQNVNMALKLSDSLPEKKRYLACKVWVEKASIFLETGPSDSAAGYVRKATQFVTDTSAPELLEHVYGVLGNYYINTGQRDSALAAYQKTLLITRKLQKSPDVILLGNMADAHLYKGDTRNAGLYLEECLKILSNGQADLRDSNSTYRHLVEYYVIAGKNKEAHNAFLTYVDLQVRHINERHIHEIKEMEAKYTLKEKERNIAGLRADVLETKLALRQKNQLIAIGLAVSLFTLLAALFGFSLQRQRRLRLEKEKLQQQISQVQLEQRLLRTQMEPHFIFNSLSVLQSFIREKNEQKAMRYISTFARLLRQSLEHSRQPLIPLREEIQSLENYMKLQQMRFEGLFDYKINCPVSLMEDTSVCIPPMLLQPFIENSIQHGFQGIKYHGHIEVTITGDNTSKTLNIVVADNGVGINHTADVRAGHQSLSTRITRERLGMLSADTGVQSDLHIRPASPTGTIIEMTVPMMGASFL